MFAPVLILLALRRSSSTALLASAAVSTAVFAATPFLLPVVAEDFGVSVGSAASISTFQLLGFVVSSGGASRLLRPSRGALVAAVVCLSLANTFSALSMPFVGLLALRFFSGLGLGTLAWLAWHHAFGSSRRMGRLATVGPIVGTGAAPLMALLADRGGSKAVFLALGVIVMLPLLTPNPPLPVEAGAPRRRATARHRPVPAAMALLACLFLLTVGGSAVFVFAGLIGRDRVGLGAGWVSLAFSLNALAGIPAAQWSGPKRLGGLWLSATGVAAAAVSLTGMPVVFFAGLALWGFAFWVGVPATFTLLAERSRYPEERAGDAQALMAAGRVVGPLAGGLIVNTVSIAWLALLAVLAMGTAGLVTAWVERHFPPLNPPGG